LIPENGSIHPILISKPAWFFRHAREFPLKLTASPIPAEDAREHESGRTHLLRHFTAEVREAKICLPVIAGLACLYDVPWRTLATLCLGHNVIGRQLVRKENPGAVEAWIYPFA
jgi:hypothetical protein